MPIFNVDEDNVPETPSVEEKVVEHKTATVYENNVPGSTTGTFITEIEGNPWTTKAWYGQILGPDDYPNRHDLALDPSLQQYFRIHGLELRTTDDLSPDLDDNVIMTVSGSANVMPGVVPNQWDCFTARTKSGKIGLFTVVELPRPLTYFSYTAYNIQYELVMYINDEVQADLDSKVVKELYFNPDDPYCPTENLVEQTNRADLMKYILRYMNIYYQLFFDRLNHTFVHRKEDTKIKVYDDHVAQFMNTVIPYQARDKARHPQARLFSVPSTEYQFKAKTIFDVLHDNELNLLPIVDQDYQRSSTWEFYSDYVVHSILMTDIELVIHPATMSSLEGNGTPLGKYVFSEDFYNEDPKKEFELAVYKALNKESVILKDLFSVIDTDYRASSDFEKFYHIPVYLWLLIREL